MLRGLLRPRTEEVRLRWEKHIAHSESLIVGPLHQML
jgi:hypothetical protein